MYGKSVPSYLNVGWPASSTLTLINPSLSDASFWIHRMQMGYLFGATQTLLQISQSASLANGFTVTFDSSRTWNRTNLPRKTTSVQTRSWFQRLAWTRTAARSPQRCIHLNRMAQGPREPRTGEPRRHPATATSGRHGCDVRCNSARNISCDCRIDGPLFSVCSPLTARRGLHEPFSEASHFRSRSYALRKGRGWQKSRDNVVHEHLFAPSLRKKSHLLFTNWICGRGMRKPSSFLNEYWFYLKSSIQVIWPSGLTGLDKNSSTFVPVLLTWSYFELA